MKKIAVVLSGCGYLDGSEVTEVVSLIIELSKSGAQYDFFAPNKKVPSVAHFEEGLSDPGQRNCLEEAARITRGKIKDLNDLSPSRYEGLALPGGYGAAKNLSTWAQDGYRCSVNPKLKEVVSSFKDSSKPILAICIAPALIAKILGEGVNVTIGSDEATAKEIEKTGAEHITCDTTDFVTDRESKIISTPAYMTNAKPHEVHLGIQKAAKEFLEMC